MNILQEEFNYNNEKPENIEYVDEDESDELGEIHTKVKTTHQLYKAS